MVWDLFQKKKKNKNLCSFLSFFVLFIVSEKKTHSNLSKHTKREQENKPSTMSTDTSNEKWQIARTHSLSFPKTIPFILNNGTVWRKTHRCPLKTFHTAAYFYDAIAAKIISSFIFLSSTPISCTLLACLKHAGNSIVCVCDFTRCLSFASGNKNSVSIKYIDTNCLSHVLLIFP